MRKALIITTLFFAFNLSLSAQEKVLTWKLPDTWEDTKTQKPMRIATLSVKKNKTLQISVTRFPGNVGGELANVNRWRGQIGLAPVKAEELAKQLEVIDSKAGKAKLLNISNNGKQMLALMIPYSGSTYFFKLLGKADEVKGSHKITR